MKKLSWTLLLGVFLFAAACGRANGPQLGDMGNGMLDKSGDATLTALIQSTARKFTQLEFRGEKANLSYNLFIPPNLEGSKKYPLVLFMGDASTVGTDARTPLKQGYGALVWATDEAQSKNPCFVLVPQFSDVAVNDQYQQTPEVEGVLELLRHVASLYPVDTSRIYATGQSMGGMISMLYNIDDPGIFAASLFVDCHWDSAGFNKLVHHPFVMIYAGDKGKAFASMEAIQNACREQGVAYTWSEWSARLPLAEQDALAQTMLDKGQPVNLFGFENGTVLPENGEGSEHMYSFDHAYQLTPVREWLFTHSLDNPRLHN